jgi:hypothetical protein
MFKKNTILTLLLLLTLTGCIKKHISSDSDYYELLKSEPIQDTLSDPKTFNTDLGFTFTSTHSYQIAARVLRREEYSWDTLATVSPMDLALGWNKMSDKSLLDKAGIVISQSTRFYYWKVPSFNTLSRSEIEENSANVHIIPANDRVKDYLSEKVKKDDLIYLEGYLVDVKKESSGRTWNMKTSTSRKDTGMGACEILYVTKVVHIVDKS